jgi:hypothetical protein
MVFASAILKLIDPANARGLIGVAFERIQRVRRAAPSHRNCLQIFRFKKIRLLKDDVALLTETPTWLHSRIYGQ